jgi:hypothetical protein
MSSTEPADDQLPLPLDDGQKTRSRVVLFAPRANASVDGENAEAGLPAFAKASARLAKAPEARRRPPRPTPRPALEPPRGPLTDAEVAHRRAMLEHLTRLPAVALAKVGQSA